MSWIASGCVGSMHESPARGGPTIATHLLHRVWKQHPAAVYRTSIAHPAGRLPGLAIAIGIAQANRRCAMATKSGALTLIKGRRLGIIASWLLLGIGGCGGSDPPTTGLASDR